MALGIFTSNQFSFSTVVTYSPAFYILCCYIVEQIQLAPGAASCQSSLFLLIHCESKKGPVCFRPYLR
jgi:hypothetical protein